MRAEVGSGMMVKFVPKSDVFATTVSLPVQFVSVLMAANIADTVAKLRTPL